MLTLAIAAVGFTIAVISGCGRNGYDDYNGGGRLDDENRPDSDAVDIADDIVDDIADDADVADPKVRDGFNGNFSTPTDAYLKCQIKDMDVSGSDLLVQCGAVSNSTFRVSIPSDPLASSYARIAGGAPMRIGLDDGSYHVVNSEQVVESGVGTFVPFNLEGVPEICGVAYSGAEGKTVSMLLDPVEGETEDESVSPLMVRSAVVANDSEGAGSLFVLASDSLLEGGVIMRYGLGEAGALDPRADGAPIRINAGMPAAMERIGQSDAIVLDSDPASPAIEFVKLGSEDPTVSVALPEAVVSLPEIATDGKIAVIPALSGALLVFDIEGRAVVGTLAGSGKARGVAMEDGKAYVSYDEDVRVIDLSDPANPALAQEIIGVGKDLGAIAVKSGKVYVAATARWYEGDDVVEACLSGDPKVVCRSHIIAIDPNEVNP